MDAIIPILLLVILAELWWFGARCSAYLSDIRDLLRVDEENRVPKGAT